MDEEIKELLKKNLELTENIYKTTKYIKRFVIFSQIMGVLKIILIAIPIILGIIYLPPLLGSVMGQYQELLGAKDIVDVKQISPGIFDLLGK